MPPQLKNEPRVLAESFSSRTMSLGDTPCWYSTSAGAVLVPLISSPKHRHKADAVSPSGLQTGNVQWWKWRVCTESSKFQAAECAESRR